MLVVAFAALIVIAKNAYVLDDQRHAIFVVMAAACDWLRDMPDHHLVIRGCAYWFVHLDEQGGAHVVTCNNGH